MSRSCMRPVSCMSAPAARVTGQAAVCWECIADVQQPGSAAVKARHGAAVHLHCKAHSECSARTPYLFV